MLCKTRTSRWSWSGTALLLSLLTACSGLSSGYEHQRSGRLDVAIAAYEQHVRNYPNDAGAHNNLANAYLQRQDFARALMNYKLALDQTPDPAYLDNLEQAYRLALKRAQDPALVKEAHDFIQASDKLAFLKGLPRTDTAREALVTARSSDSAAEAKVSRLADSQAQVAPSASTTPVDFASLRPTAVKWAVVIGVGDYDQVSSGYAPLPHAAADARKVSDFLVQKGGFAKEHVRLLVDKDATAENIREALGRFLRNNANNPDDIVFVYYSGHGDLLERTDAYLVPYGASRQHLVSQGIPLEELNRSIGKLDSARVAMFIDACNSGSIIQGVNSKGLLQDVRGIAQNFLNLAGQGRLIMTSSQADEESLELPNTGGLFTHYLLKGLNGEADIIERDKRISVEELYQYVRRQVLADSRNIAGRSQTPQKNGNLDGILIQLK